MAKKDIFTQIYKDNYWGDSESISGSGSSVKSASNLIKKLPKLIEQLSVRSILDLPCGDFNWFQYILSRDIRYQGADIVQELVESNNDAYSSTNISFSVIDITNDNLPNVDLIFCRDCLVHLPLTDITKALINVVQSNSTYFATTNFPLRFINKDIVRGQWRPLNLRSRPFNLPQPIHTIFELSYLRYFDKSLSVWKISDLRPAVDALNT